ncbi:MAG: purine-binding chemotaxis protein CheW [Sphingomonadales bacterium]|nr:purine-binding chemotaxis protein CheW [Sphingomonadales bacterium]
MAELLLIVRLGGERIALAAAEVESVVEIEALTPVPGAAGHIAGLAALRSRVLTVIDCLASLDPSKSLAEGSTEAVMAVVDGHPYALLVEAVEDVVEASGERRPAAASLTGGWRRIGRATIEAEGDLLLLVDVEALIAGPMREAA